MKLVRVLVPFNDKVTGAAYKVNDEVEMSDERIAEIKAVNTNMLIVLEDAKPKAKKTTKAKAE